MPTTAQQIIESAYASSTANDPGKLATDYELWTELDRIFQMRYALWSEAADEAALSAQIFTFSGAPASVMLPTDVIDIARIEVDGEKANLIPVIEKERSWHAAPAVYRVGMTMYSRGQTGDPIAGSMLTAYLDDAPASMTSLASTIDSRFPVRFHKLLILELALYLDAKDEGRDAGQHQKLVEEYARQDAMFKTVALVSESAKDSSVNTKGPT